MKIEGILDVKIQAEIYNRKVNWTKGVHRIELYEDTTSSNYFIIKDSVVITLSTLDLVSNGFVRRDYSLPIKEF